MGDKRELVLTVTILVVGFLASPLVVDSIPFMSIQPPVIKVILCFAISIGSFFLIVCVWAFFRWVFRRSD